MSDEFDTNPDNNYSSFWPLLILIIGVFIWIAVQDYELNIQRNAYNAQLDDKRLQTALAETQTIETKYKALMGDLYQTAQKDPTAAQIVKDAVQLGMIHIQPNATNSAAAPAEPTPSK